ncbi:MAG: glucosaminidase domain-containing protein [Anaerovoracaceae bacterium]
MISVVAMGQGNATYRYYIERFKDIAVEEMKKYQIPASITLAQGLLESGAGQSVLAIKANNHFGIKCSGDWTGPYILKDDDYKNEKFRVYKNARESYEDHSVFLKNRSRYASLFALDTKDYIGWAHGLKRAGYATNPKYAYSLIHIIETYALYQYDIQKGRKHISKRDMKFQTIAANDNTHIIKKNNDNYYLIAHFGDTFKTLEKETGVSWRKIVRYNELDKDYIIAEGDILYLEKKRTKADKAYKGCPHTILVGESMYTISQRYGIRLKSLYKMNHLTPDYQLRVGDQLKVR